MNQKLFFVTKQNCKSIPIGEKEVFRVWTLYRSCDENDPPKLPFHPRLRDNAFLEDIGHDYTINGGVLRYSAGTGGLFEPDFKGVWILVEYEDGIGEQYQFSEFDKLFESLMDRKPVILDEDQIEDIRQLLFYSEQYEIDSNKLFDGVRAADHYENYLDNVSK
ncbi:MAG: hypothetical protein WCP55_09785, partial [Lentisphaerota bacterium]